MIVLAQSVGQLQDTLAAMQRFLPRLLAFVAVLVVGYVVARLLARAVRTVLARTGFEHAVRRGGVGDALARTGYDAGALLSRVVFLALMLLVLQLAFAAFGPNPISASLTGVIAFLPRLFVAGLILVLAAAIAATARELIVAQIGALSYGRLLGACAYAVILGIGVFAALNHLQVAPAIVNGLFYGLIAIVAGVTIVAVGGGGIAPMRQRWEQALTRVDAESTRMRETVQVQREQRAAAEREEQERQAQREREEQQQLAEQERAGQQRLAEQERAAAEHTDQQRVEQRLDHEHPEHDYPEHEVHARRAREEQERRTAREFEELAQQGIYTEDQLRAARELAEFERQHGAGAEHRIAQRPDDEAGQRLDAFNGERRRSTRDTSEIDRNGTQREPADSAGPPSGDGYTGEQRRAAWELEAFRQEEVAVEQERQATQDLDFFEHDVEYMPPPRRPAMGDQDDATAPRPDTSGLDHRRRLRTARRLPFESERPSIRYRGPEPDREQRYDHDDDEHTRPGERTRPVGRTPWDAPDS